MTKKTPPSDPILAGLGTSGTALVTAILADYEPIDCEPDARERELLRAAGEVRDHLTMIESEIERIGLTVPTTTGSDKANPLLGECRQYAATLGRLLAGIHIGDTSGRNPQKVRAGRIRWERDSRGT